MRATHCDIARAVARSGIITRRGHPHLIPSIDYLVKTGRLATVLPGVYARPDQAATVAVRALAAMHVCPDGVVVGRAAARLSYWPELDASEVVCADRRRHAGRPGIVFIRRTVPDDLVVETAGIRLSAPALTALDLCDSMGGDAIDQVLRRRAAGLTQLRDALDLTARRSGNRVRRALLLDSRDEPWSQPERAMHRILRTAHITGWTANAPVVVNGQTYSLDVAFRGQRIAIEIDGREFHTSARAFERDRERQNQLILAGWMVLRFTWAMVTEQPEAVLATIRRALG